MRKSIKSISSRMNLDLVNRYVCKKRAKIRKCGSHFITKFAFHAKKNSIRSFERVKPRNRTLLTNANDFAEIISRKIRLIVDPSEEKPQRSSEISRRVFTDLLARLCPRSR